MPKFSQDASKFSPNPPKIDPKAIQKASWSPSWPIVLKRYDLERPTSSQNAPKSGRKALQSVPTPSQMEPKTFSNPIFVRFSGTLFAYPKFTLNFIDTVSIFGRSFKPRTLKIMVSTKREHNFHIFFSTKNMDKNIEREPQTFPKL